METTVRYFLKSTLITDNKSTFCSTLLGRGGGGGGREGWGGEGLANEDPLYTFINVDTLNDPLVGVSMLANVSDRASTFLGLFTFCEHRNAC